LIHNQSRNITIDEKLTVKVNQSIEKGTITVHGKLTCPYSDTYEIKTDDIFVEGPHAHVECGTTESPFEGSISFILTNNISVTDLDKPGKEFVTKMGGTIRLTGKPGKSGFVKSSSTANPGSDVIQIDNSMLPGKGETQDWERGDTLVIASSCFNPAESETAVITEISSDKKTITLSEGLKFKHWGEIEYFNNPNGTPSTLDERAEVANLTRNIKVFSDDNDGITGAHMMIMGHGSQSSGFIDNVEFKHVGQKGVMGRYPFHWHKGGNVEGQYIKNSSIHESFNRCVTIHGTHQAEVRNNTCYNHFGHGFFLEDGIERKNKIIGNIGIRSKKVKPEYALLDSESGNEDDTRFMPPATFWISNPDNIITDNVAARSDGTGFWMAFHTDDPCLTTDTTTGRPDCYEQKSGEQRNRPSAFMKTLAFSDNTAHSSMIGITHDGGPNGHLNGIQNPDGTYNPNPLNIND